MSSSMYQKFIYLILIFFLSISCAKKETEIVIPANSDKSFEIYKEAVRAMNSGDVLYASRKFSEAEAILPQIEFSAKAALMSSYCLYLINFYPEAMSSLERFITNYPADKNIAYAHYLIAITLYEQILDEKKDINPLLDSKAKIEFFLEKYPDTEYAIDLKFKMDLPFLIFIECSVKSVWRKLMPVKSMAWESILSSTVTLLF